MVILNVRVSIIHNCKNLTEQTIVLSYKARSSGDQINQLTSYLDASNVYGSTKEDQDALRLGRKGKLKYTNLHIRKPLLPALDPNTAEEEGTKFF